MDVVRATQSFFRFKVQNFFQKNVLSLEEFDDIYARRFSVCTHYARTEARVQSTCQPWSNLTMSRELVTRVVAKRQILMYCSLSA